MISTHFHSWTLSSRSLAIDWCISGQSNWNRSPANSVERRKSLLTLLILALNSVSEPTSVSLRQWTIASYGWFDEKTCLMLSHEWIDRLSLRLIVIDGQGCQLSGQRLNCIEIGNNQFNSSVRYIKIVISGTKWSFFFNFLFEFCRKLIFFNFLFEFCLQLIFFQFFIWIFSKINFFSTFYFKN